MKKSIIELKGIHSGKDIYILGAGPSMDNIPPDFFEDKITIGINNVWLKYKCNYYIYKDGFFYFKKNGEQIIDAIKEKYPEAQVVFSEYDKGGRRQKNDFNRDYYYFEHEHNQGELSIDKNNCENKLAVSRSTITSGIHLAFYMGAKNIIVAGHDCELNKDGKIYFKEYQEHRDKQGLGDDNFETIEDYNKWFLSKWMPNIRNDTLKLKEFLKINIYKLNPF